MHRIRLTPRNQQVAKFIKRIMLTGDHIVDSIRFKNSVEASMGYAELIRTLERLPTERQAEVFDFDEFLAARCHAANESGAGTGLPPDALVELLSHPIEVKETFTAMKRDDIYDRACLR